jgi:hypothetical protein
MELIDMPRKTDREMIQTAVRLPKGLYDRLQKDGGPGGMGEEIRRRLESTVRGFETPADAVTQVVLEQISGIAGNLATRGDDWHSSRFVFDVFRAAINVVLLHHRPLAETTPETIAHLKDLYGNKDAEEMGRFIASAVIYALSVERFKNDLKDLESVAAASLTVGDRPQQGSKAPKGDKPRR